MHSFYLPSGNLDAIVVTGPDAAKLLQGQLTCDVEALPDAGVTRGALCNNKGRVLATFMLVRHGPDFHVVLNQGLGTIFTVALKKYLPFYKCELRANPGIVCGAVGDSIAMAFAPDGLPQPGECRPLENGWICAIDRVAQQYLVFSTGDMRATSAAPVGTVDDWLVTGMRSGQFPFTAEDSEKYTPQELHLDRHGYISFTKGCYTGQEIVARLHYRGKLKKLLFLLEAPLGTVTEAEPLEILVDGNSVGTALKTLVSDGMQHGIVSLPAEFESQLPQIVKNRAGLEVSMRVF